MVQAPHLVDGRELEPSESPEYIASAPMSFEEYLDWDYEGGLVEWVDGRAYVYVSATFERQQVVNLLSRLLGTWAEEVGAGVVATAPYAMRSERGGPGCEPDIVFVTNEHRQRLQSKFLLGPPDLVIEVVSPDSISRDRAVKRREYAAAGISEYWVIDVRPNIRRIDFFVLEEGEFVARDVVCGVNRSVGAEGFWIRPDWPWDVDRPVLGTLAEIPGRPLFQTEA